MKIGGFQKMTMLDFPSKVACTLFTYGCNLRCPFCHNASLVIDEAELLSSEEVFSYLKKRAGVLDGICISGGEPLLQKDIIDFMKRVRKMGFKIKLDTNGTLPNKLKEIIDLGLVDYIAMDIKNSLEKYPLAVGIEGFDVGDITKSIKIIMKSGIEYEFRTTVVRELHKIEDFVAIGKMICGAEKYYLQCFKDSGNLIGNNLSAYERRELEAFSEAISPYVSLVDIRGV